MNQTGFQPRFPCADAVPNLLMNRQHFLDGIKVFWTDVPEGDALAEPDIYFTTPQPSYTYGSPATFPKKNSVIRIPRVVRLCSPSFNPFGTGVFLTDTMNEQFREFAIQIKQFCKDNNIFFQWSPTNWTGGIVSDFILIDQLHSSISSNLIDFDANCVFLADTLNFTPFVINGTQQFTLHATDTGFADGNWLYFGVQTDDNFTSVLLDSYIPNAKIQYQRFPRYKNIIQPFRSEAIYTPLDPDLYWREHNFYFPRVLEELPEKLETDLTGYELGSDFTFDLDYVKSTILQHWSL